MISKKNHGAKIYGGIICPSSMVNPFWWINLANHQINMSCWNDHLMSEDMCNSDFEGDPKR